MEAALSSSSVHTLLSQPVCWQEMRSGERGGFKNKQLQIESRPTRAKPRHSVSQARGWGLGNVWTEKTWSHSPTLYCVFTDRELTSCCGNGFNKTLKWGSADLSQVSHGGGGGVWGAVTVRISRCVINREDKFSEC